MSCKNKEGYIVPYSVNENTNIKYEVQNSLSTSNEISGEVNKLNILSSMIYTFSFVENIDKYNVIGCRLKITKVEVNNGLQKLDYMDQSFQLLNDLTNSDDSYMFYLSIDLNGRIHKITESEEFSGKIQKLMIENNDPILSSILDQFKDLESFKNSMQNTLPDLSETKLINGKSWKSFFDTPEPFPLHYKRNIKVADVSPETIEILIQDVITKSRNSKLVAEIDGIQNTICKLSAIDGWPDQIESEQILNGVIIPVHLGLSEPLSFRNETKIIMKRLY